MDWFTADLHLGHGNAIKYCQRPFMTEIEKQSAIAYEYAHHNHTSIDPIGLLPISQETIDRHDTEIINNINDRVAVKDTLRVIGDFSLCKSAKVAEYLDRIRCKNVHLVWGNHDRRNIGVLFRSAIEQGPIYIQKQMLWVNHYPLRSWWKSNRGSFHLHGHCHCRLNPEHPYSLILDVGIDGHGLCPWSYDEIKVYMAPRQSLWVTYAK